MAPLNCGAFFAALEAQSSAMTHELSLPLETCCGMCADIRAGAAADSHVQHGHASLLFLALAPILLVFCIAAGAGSQRAADWNGLPQQKEGPG
jgi:hypothetical protein